MRRIKNFSSIWNVERVQYSIGDFVLPVPLTFTQIAWLVGSGVFVVMFKNTFLFAWTDNILIKYVALPVGITWFMSKKTFDGKKPYSFLKSVLGYLLRHKRTYAGKKVSYRRQWINEYITVVKGEIYVSY